MTAQVSDNAEQHRYELALDGSVIGVSDYVMQGGDITFTHVEVDPAYAGKGLAAQLVRESLEDVRSRGLSVLPQCPYVRKFISDNPHEYLSLVPHKARNDFGLPLE
ncbi:MAG: GNAT family N-acetyltransferase [Candidatus Nanopelagicales bacterium]